MPGEGGHGALRVLVYCWLIGFSEAPLVHADRIRLKDGTEVSGTMVGKDGEHVMVRVPRDAVESVNGQPLPPPVVAGSVAPPFQAMDLAGQLQQLPDNGAHATLLQFWATWCPHCRHDLSLMKELVTQYQGKGLRLVTVSIDRDLTNLRTFIQNEQLPYPVIHAATASWLPERYELQGVPAYYLIDAYGTIIKTWSGSVTESPSDLKDVIAQLFPSMETSTTAKVNPAASAGQ